MEILTIIFYNSLWYYLVGQLLNVTNRGRFVLRFRIDIQHYNGTLI